MGDPLLSVCVAVRDDAELLARCLVAAAPVADDIVVTLPAGSARAMRLAARFGARTVAAPHRADRGATFMAGLGACRGRWTLVLNDDELIEPLERTALERTILDTRARAATVELVAPGPRGGSDRTHLPRLVRTGVAQYLGAACVTLADDDGVAVPGERANWPQSGLRLLAPGPRYAGHALPATTREQRRLLEDLAERPSSAEIRLLLAQSVLVSAGGDLLDAPGTRVALALLTPAVAPLLEAPSRPLAEPLVALALRLAHATGDAERTVSWSRRAGRSFGATARLLYAEGERALARAALDPRRAPRARALFETVPLAPSGPGALRVPPRLRGSRARIRAAAAAALAGDPVPLRAVLASAANGDRVEALLTRGWLEARTGRADLACAAVDEAVRRERRDPRPLLARAILERHAGRPDAAAAAGERAAALVPGWHLLQLAADPAPSAASGLLAPWAALRDRLP